MWLLCLVDSDMESLPGMVPGDTPSKTAFGDWFGPALELELRARLLANRKWEVSNAWRCTEASLFDSHPWLTAEAPTRAGPTGAQVASVLWEGPPRWSTYRRRDCLRTV